MVSIFSFLKGILMIRQDPVFERVQNFGFWNKTSLK